MVKGLAKSETAYAMARAKCVDVSTSRGGWLLPNDGRILTGIPEGVQMEKPPDNRFVSEVHLVGPQQFFTGSIKLMQSQYARC